MATSEVEGGGVLVARVHLRVLSASSLLDEMAGLSLDT